MYFVHVYIFKKFQKKKKKIKFPKSFPKKIKSNQMRKFLD